MFLSKMISEKSSLLEIMCSVASHIISIVVWLHSDGSYWGLPSSSDF